LNYEQKFDELYEYFEKQIEEGDLHGDYFDRVDSVLGLIYGVEDSVGGIFDSLSSDEEKRIFLQDFKAAVIYLSDGDERYEEIAKMVVSDRQV